MSDFEKRLTASLNKRKEQGIYRTLKPPSGLIDFCSNDYLGFARSLELKNKIKEFSLTDYQRVNGSTGSRLISGNSTFAETLESELATFHKAETGLIFNSGYDANVGLISALGRSTETIFYDELIHASFHDGMRMSKATCISFKHNDLNDLKAKLSKASGNKLIVVESVYSMDGDFAPLQELVEICKEYDAHLIVDEAHAVGMFGEKGEGRVVELGLEKEVYARVITFGKALGTHGAIVLGNELLKNYLINYARSFIFTTAMPIEGLISIKSAYDMLSVEYNKKLITSNLINLFKQKILSIEKLQLIESKSQIQSIIISGNDKVKSFAKQIQEDGFDVKPLVSPTVPVGTERVRICIHAFNTENEIEALATSLEKAAQEL